MSAIVGDMLVAGAGRLHVHPVPPPTPPRLVPCNTYGCTRLKPEGHVFCDDCAAEYRDDPEAFK